MRGDSIRRNALFSSLGRESCSDAARLGVIDGLQCLVWVWVSEVGRVGDVRCG